MIKEFCDECGKEVKTNVVSDRVQIVATSGQKFEIICSDKEEVWNNGHLCFGCLVKLLKEAEVVKNET